MANKSLPVIRSAQDLQQWRQKLQPLLNKAQTPAVPVNFRVLPSAGGNKVLWAPVRDADGYELLRTATGDFAAAKVITIDGGKTTSYFDAVTDAEGKVYYKLRATAGTAERKHSVKGELTSALSSTALTPVTSVNGESGDVTVPTGVTSANGNGGEVALTTDNVAEGSTNLYFKDARVVALASTLVLRDTEANRPTASIAGRLFFATDTLKIYRDSGTGWDDVTPAGGTASAGASLLNGASNPDAATGSNGDFYINTNTHVLFGPKTNGAWGAGVSLVGPQGVQGATGATGPTGPGVSAGGTAGQVLVKATGTDYDTEWQNAGMGSLPTRSTATITTAALASNATEADQVTLAKVFALLRVQVSCKARVRLYKTAAARTADASRASTTPPAAGTPHGVICDFYLDGSTGAPLAFLCSPDILGANGDSPAVSTIYASITNLDTAQAVTVTLTFEPVEQ